MISFRFHLVSLVAVFLALGLGVLTGTTVLNRGIVAQLERQTDALSRDLAEHRDDIQTLEAQADVWAAFGEEATAPLLSGRLSERRVLLVAQDGTDAESLSGVRRALEEAGAEVVGVLSVGGRLALPADGDRAELASVVGGDPSEEPDELLARTASLLAERLAAGPGGSDSLERLLDGGFLVLQGLGDQGLRAVGGSEEAVVALAGGPSPSRLPPSRFLVPLVARLAGSGVPVAAGEPANGEEQEPPFVTLLRSDGDVSASIATQDNVDQIPGQVGLVLALEDLLEGTVGHYGVKDGASRPVPEFS